MEAKVLGWGQGEAEVGTIPDMGSVVLQHRHLQL